MGNLLYVWLSGAAILFAIYVYVTNHALRNSIPGTNPAALSIFRRSISRVDPKRLNETGQKYRLRAIALECLWAIWIFGFGPLFYVLHNWR